jgi:hypothetical protein
MGNSESSKHFLSSISEFISPTLLAIVQYLYHPIELIEKYKSAMPHDIELLMLSTGILIYSLYIQYKRRTSIFLILIVPSIFLWLYTVHALQVAFSARNDPLFWPIFKDFLYYAGGYFVLVFLISYISDRLLSSKH